MSLAIAYVTELVSSSHCLLDLLFLTAFSGYYQRLLTSIRMHVHVLQKYPNSHELIEQ